MGLWGNIGKVALTAAPYVAAPFTGGLSLYAAPAANAAVRKWSASDAQKNAARGIAPSSFDKYLGMAGDIASIASPTGAVGALGKAANIGTKIKTGIDLGTGVAGAVAAARAAKTPSYGTGDEVVGAGGRNRGGIGPSSSVMPRGGYRYNQNPLNQLDQANPNLAQALFQGRQEAIRNQPFRLGHDINTVTDDSDPNNIKTTTYRTPPIFQNTQSQGGRRRQPNAY